MIGTFNFERNGFLRENERYIKSFEETETEFHIRPKNTLIPVGETQKLWGPGPMAIIHLTDILAPFDGKWNVSLQRFVVPKATLIIADSQVEKTAAADSQMRNGNSLSATVPNVEFSIKKLRDYFSKQLSQLEIKQHVETLSKSGLSPSEISLETGAPKSTVYRFMPKIAVSVENREAS